MNPAAPLLALLIALGVPALAVAEAPRTIGRADPVRKQLLDALRPTVEADLEQTVEFRVTSLKVQDGWAFAVVVPQKVGGGRIDYLRTRYASEVEAGVFDGGILYALLHREAGAWTTKAFLMAPNDVAWSNWPQEYGAPAAVMDLPGR
jgi:hypothetical protein